MVHSDHPSNLVVSLSESTLEDISSHYGIPSPTQAAQITGTSLLLGVEEDDPSKLLRGLSRRLPFSSSFACEDLNISVTTVKRYNFLVAGPSGSGKSTFCKRLLCRYFKDFELHKVKGEEDDGPTVAIGERGRGIKVQGNTKIIITIVDTPGFGDSLNNNDHFAPVEQYILDQNLKYEKDEGFRQKYTEEDDTRVHCCFYFLAPHRVSPLDCEFLRRLQTKVPITPIVAKADTMTVTELETQLRRIHTFLQESHITIFDYGERNVDTSWMDASSIHGTTYKHVGRNLSISSGDIVADDNESLSSPLGHDTETVPPTLPQIPNVFAVISGERHYIWGKASEEDPSHSDTQRLHKLLFREGSLGRLQRHTDRIHEAWRLKLTLENQKEDYEREACIKQKMKDLTYRLVLCTGCVMLLYISLSEMTSDCIFE